MDSSDPTYSEPVSWKIFLKNIPYDSHMIFINNRICLEQYVYHKKKDEIIKSVSQNRT